MKREFAVLVVAGLLVIAGLPGGLVPAVRAQQAGEPAAKAVLGPITLQASLDRSAGTAETLVFRIVLDTHSADLSRIAVDQQVVLRAGGAEVRPLAWKVTTDSGHHVEGVLTFPAKTGTGSAVLDGNAREAELVIRRIGGVAERDLKVPVTP